MEVQSNRLMDFLTTIDRYMTSKMDIVMVGGTALTLLGKKESTKDIDICFGTEKDMGNFVKVAERLGYSMKQNRLAGHGLLIDMYCRGYIFCVQLPDDYAEKAVEIRRLEKIGISALSPEDIIITKTARLDERDLEDIGTVFSSFEIDKENLVSRYFSVMENSAVKDAKANLLLLAETFAFPGALRERIRMWNYA